MQDYIDVEQKALDEDLIHNINEYKNYKILIDNPLS